MLKSLYPDVDWDVVRVVGFDMDGTLYDEADFIVQVYRPIARILSAVTGADERRMHLRLFRRWLEKGSSYSRIFEEALAAEGVSGEPAAAAVSECLDVFRSFSPALSLPPRVEAILECVCEAYPVFLISDGSAGLQRRKFDSLELHRWFADANIAISGSRGEGFSKPATRMLREIQALATPLSAGEVVFFGDREVDAQFAANAGFQFVEVKCMHPLGNGARGSSSLR